MGRFKEGNDEDEEIVRKLSNQRLKPGELAISFTESQWEEWLITANIENRNDRMTIIHTLKMISPSGL